VQVGRLLEVLQDDYPEEVNRVGESREVWRAKKQEIVREFLEGTREREAEHLREKAVIAAEPTLEASCPHPPELVREAGGVSRRCQRCGEAVFRVRAGEPFE